MPPAARITDMHTCPMTTGPVPHVGGPILPPGAPTVLINFLPAATVTSLATCVGPPDAIVKGSAGVMINFLPAARLGDLTSHGGVIVMGSPNVIIGEMGAPSPGVAGMGGMVAGLMQSLGIDRAIKSLYGVENAAVKKLAEFGAHHLAGNKKLQKWLADRPSSGGAEVLRWAGDRGGMLAERPEYGGDGSGDSPGEVLRSGQDDSEGVLREWD